MARRNGIIDTLLRFSLGVVLILFWGWMWIRAEQLFPINTAVWITRIQLYLVFTAVIFALDSAVSRKVERPLFEISFVKALPKFLISAGISLAILFVIGSFYQGNVFGDIKGAVSGIGLGVILFHAFFVAVIEEKIFRNWLSRQLYSGGIKKNIVWFVTAIIFAFFHYTLSGSLITIAIYIPLAYIFMYVREKYSPQTDMANAGVHFAWNLFVLGFLM